MTTSRATEKAVFAAFADLFAYPRGDVAGAARACAALLEPGSPPAAALKTFASWAAQLTTGEVEEVYSETFDLDPVCPPYVGHWLCPDPARRNLFLSALAAVYSGEGFQPLEELGDHVAEILRFLAVAREPDVRLELLRDGLLPALGQMKASFADVHNPYRPLVDALLAYVSLRVRKHGGAREEARP